jgi:hypothetical protein
LRNSWLSRDCEPFNVYCYDLILRERKIFFPLYIKTQRLVRIGLEGASTDRASYPKTGRQTFEISLCVEFAFFAGTTPSM